ncbi:MAG: hypothetical protein ACOYJG_03625 [Prevotella sp.]|jgi:hypothetical protein
MRKYVYLLVLPLLALLATSCDPSRGDEAELDPSLTEEQLRQAVKVEQVTQDGAETNEFIFSVSNPTCIVQVLDKNNSIQASGYSGDITILPSGSSEIPLTFRTINHDGSITQFTQTFTVEKWVGVPEFMKYLYGENLDGSSTWTWDTESEDGCWGNGRWQKSTGPQWWKVYASDIDAQCEDKGLPYDGLDGWMKFSFEGSKVETSRGETGTLVLSTDVTLEGWDIGTMTFNGTIPLLGVQVNYNNERQYTYQILTLDEEHMCLCAKEPTGTVAWFWNYKKIN